jgi:hypothetical protein
MACFGFSVGDFVTCLNLIHEVAQALSDSRGSASEYKSLFGTLVSLNQALAASELIYLQWDTQDASPICKQHATAMINGILFERQKCKELLESFLKSSQPYTDAFVKARGRSIVRNWRKVTWLFKKEDVNYLERQLQRHLQALRIYTDALFQYEYSTLLHSDADVFPEIKQLLMRRRWDQRLEAYFQMSPTCGQTCL